MLGTYRRHFWRVTLSALVVFGALEILETVFALDDNGTNEAVFFGSVFLVLLIDTFGTVFYPGLLDRLVGEELHGHDHQSIPRVVFTLPYWRLIRAELVLVLFVGVAALLLFVPGLIVFTVFCLIGPMITIEDHSVIGAFRRSVELVRPHFWLVLILITVPTLFEDFVSILTDNLVHSRHPFLQFLAGGCVGFVIGSFVGLIAVHLAYRMIAAHPLDT